jgi:hypothetical protein
VTKGTEGLKRIFIILHIYIFFLLLYTYTYVIWTEMTKGQKG